MSIDRKRRLGIWKKKGRREESVLLLAGGRDAPRWPDFGRKTSGSGLPVNHTQVGVA